MKKILKPHRTTKIRPTAKNQKVLILTLVAAVCLAGVLLTSTEIPSTILASVGESQRTADSKDPENTADAGAAAALTAAKSSQRQGKAKTSSDSQDSDSRQAKQCGSGTCSTAKTSVEGGKETTQKETGCGDTKTPTTASSPSSTTSNGIATLRSSVGKSLINAFDQLEFTITINPRATCLGCFSPAKHRVEMQSANVGTFRHEMGHFLDVLKNNPSKSQEFTSIFNREKEAYDGPNSYYITKNPQEYFAQAYRNYLESPGNLKAKRPLTYDYISKQAGSVSAADISGTYRRYSCFW